MVDVKALCESEFFDGRYLRFNGGILGLLLTGDARLDGDLMVTHFLLSPL